MDEKINERRQYLIDYYCSWICDMIPYDTPNYREEVIKQATKMAEEDLAQELNNTQN